MTTNVLIAQGGSGADGKYLSAIQRALKALAHGHEEITELDKELRKLRAANRKTMKEVATLLRRVQRSI
jgi:hypothetical protein